MLPNLKWYASNVKAIFKKEEKEGLLRLGLLVRQQARRNLTENGQNDTKFLWNSIYVATPDKVTQVAPDGKYLSTKTGKMVKRESGPIVQPAEGVHVGVAAEYGIHPELENSFLYKSIDQVAGRQAENAMAGLGTGIIVGDEE
jgi:hypothetical protein